ncbi:MAG: hypothetical protein RR585_07770 [Coprobacillus sp.]
MFFKKTYTIDSYNTQAHEPESSVIECSDYDFATTLYPKKDFRYDFVEAYIKYIKNTYNIDIYTCKFERPKNTSDFINFYIYLYQDEVKYRYRIEDKNDIYVTSFYKVLKEYPLPVIDENFHLQFLIKNISSVMYDKVLKETFYDIRESINKEFIEIESITHWNTLYIFIKEEYFDKLIQDTDYLLKIKDYCFQSALKHNPDDVLKDHTFSIRIENYAIYKSIGGQHYFNSDYMFDCLAI